MVRQIAVDVDNNFSGGLITQATGINFPKNSCTDTLNCIHHELGYARRRPGFDFEDNYQTKTIDRTNNTVVNYFWRNVTGDGATNLLVLQVGSTLYFYEASNAGFSAGALSTTIDLTTFKPSGAPSPSLAECQFATGLGYLFVVHPTLEPFYVTYDTNTQTATGTQITVQVRDTEGVDDGLAVDTRPGSVVNTHQYNAYNQGWYVKNGDFFSAFGGAVGGYPSNADVWWIFKNVDDEFDTATVTSVLFDRGTSQAPKGHYILDAFHQDRSTASGIASLPIVSASYHRPSTTAFFSGRAWYAGTQSNGFESKIYFSQILQNIKQAGKCYSAEDPTAQDFDQLEADDGGWLSIPGIGLIQKLVPLGGSLIVFGSQGIWQITGSTGTGFTAVDYSVNFLSSVKTLSASSFVDVEGYPAWWTLDGIYLLTPAQNNLQIQSLTDQKIKEYYLAIPPNCKRFARGAYDPRSHTVQWIFKSTEPSGLTDTYTFDRVLNFNTLAGGFYPWSVPTAPVSIHGLFLSDGFGSVPSTDNVVVGGNQVIAGGSGNPVIETNFGSLVLDFENKYLVSYPDSGSYKFTFADYNNTDYLDWYTYDSTGVDAEATFTSGYKLPTQGAKRLSAPYIYLFSDLTDLTETEFDFSSQWNFSNTNNSGKWSSIQRVSLDAGNFDILRNRLKVRGSGFVVQFKITSSPGKPFNILGWTISETVATRD